MYTVTRQRQWPDGDNVVEISSGGLNYTNPDALVAKYPGEFEEFTDPREAAETALEIAESWRADCPGVEIGVAYGSTGGYTLPFSPCGVEELREWSQAEWDSLPKCGCCGEPFPDKRERWYANDWDDIEYCSERCADKVAEAEAEAMRRDPQEIADDMVDALREFLTQAGIDALPDCDSIREEYAAWIGEDELTEEFDSVN